MIRFIDLRGQDTGYEFAFYDTVTDKFCEFDGDQTWDFQEEFIYSFKEEAQYLNATYVDVERFLQLMPEWTKQTSSSKEPKPLLNTGNGSLPRTEQNPN